MDRQGFDGEMDKCFGKKSAGGFHVQQPEKGYRFSIDSLILASMTDMSMARRVADLGAGCGIISLILARHNPSSLFWCVEIQSELARIADFNVRRNHLESQVTVLCRDLKRLSPVDLGGCMDLVVSNPPFRPVGSARTGPDLQRTIAMHELRVTLPELVSSAHRLLEPWGRLVMIHDIQRLPELVFYLKDADLQPTWILPVQPREGSNAIRVVIEAVKGANRGIEMLAPLVLHEDDGQYSDPVTQIIKWAGI